MILINSYSRTFACMFIMFCFFTPTASFSSGFYADLEKAQAETAEAITKVEELYKQSGECRKKVKELDGRINDTTRLKKLREARTRWESSLEMAIEKEKQNPGSNFDQVQGIRINIYRAGLEEDEIIERLNKNFEAGDFWDLKSIDKQEKALEALERECWELLAEYIAARDNLGQLKKRAENLEDLRCANLHGEFKSAANSDNPSPEKIAGILERGKDCPWYNKEIKALIKFAHRGDTAGDKDQEEQKKPTQKPPLQPPVDEEEVAQDDPNDENEYFEEVGESEAGSAADNSYDQSGNLCSSLLAQFNATYNIEHMRAILDRAQNCSWHGAGRAALQNQIDYYNEQNQRRQQYQQQQQQLVHPGTVNIVPNPFQNPYATPPPPSKNQQQPATDKLENETSVNNNSSATSATRFTSPVMGGLPLDWCLTFGSKCGKGAADAFCKEKGFSMSSSHDGPDMAPNKTYIIGNGKTCQADYCGSFYYIDCVK